MMRRAAQRCLSQRPAATLWNPAWSHGNTRPSVPTANTTTTTTSRCYSAVPDYDPSAHVDAFPSLVIGPHGTIEPQGSFAEMQAQFLCPDEDAVSELAAKLEAAKMGVVAHYYMDVELQSVLTALPQRERGLIGIADSLKMGDLAVEMCLGKKNKSQEIQAIACLGVDFMAESVATIMQRNGVGSVPVYRANAGAIGCSLAESAERDAYRAWLQQAASTHANNALHVVYINTSMETKAVSNAVVPTITCTSSNVLQTLLQASAQIPNVQIYYGPDTYMGHNLITMLDTLLQHPKKPAVPSNDETTRAPPAWTDERIARELHPAHSRATLQQLRDSIHVFGAGNCVVHHMFGAQVVQRVRDGYEKAHVTAHLEVPGEMFGIAMEQSLQGRGVVGSTADILRYISQTVQREANVPGASTITTSDRRRRRLQFILGTEAGMVTSIVQSVQDILRTSGNPQVEAEIVFPVSYDAVALVPESEELGGVVPGVATSAASGEGCSTAGGCATCPFMKMNHLDALTAVADMVIAGNETKLAAHLPPNRLQGRSFQGKSAVDWAAEPIMYMRHFAQTGRLPDELEQRVLGK